MIIQLTPGEILEGSITGAMRQVKAIRKGFQAKNGQEPTTQWQNHIEGALAERAVSKHLSLYCNGIGIVGGPDVGADIEVRCAPYDHLRLILHKPPGVVGEKGDDPDAVFWFVTGLNGRYNLRGKIRARDGQKKEFWSNPANRDDGHAYFVPTHLLHPIDAQI